MNNNQTSPDSSHNSARERDRIFISYRRDDAKGASGRVWDWLRIGFGREQVFRDVASIGAGKWRHKIEHALAASTVCIAVIGRRWADATNLPRLQDPNDMVRHELQTALAHGDREELTVIPLLVEDAQIVDIPADQLPASLRSLFGEWNVLALSESGWDDDTRRLIGAIASVSALPVNPEFEDWLALMAGARQGLTRARASQPSETPADATGMEQALEGLLQRAADAEPLERPGLKAALAALAAGNTLLAEESFERELEASQRLRQAAERLVLAERRREADAARHVASLAVIRGDLPKAVRYFTFALDAHPEDLDAALELGYVWISLGDLAQARKGFEAMLQLASAQGDPRQHSRGLRALGDVRMAEGDGAAAAAAYEAALTTAASLVRRDPAHPSGLRDLALSHDRIGTVLESRGDGVEALAAYQAALAIRTDLARRDPANTQAQRDLSLSHERIGSVSLSQGDADAALAAHQAALTIRDSLLSLDPDNSQWQRDRSVSLEKIGDVLLAQGAGAAALTSYQASLTIRRSLVSRDPQNTQWLRDLSVSQDRTGDGLRAQGDAAGALAAYQAGLAIRERLVTRDPANSQWQRDHFVSLIKIGDGLLARGDEAEALLAYRQSQSIAAELAQRDPQNAQWRRDGWVSTIKICQRLLAHGDGAGAWEASQEGLRIAEDLTRRDPTNTRWQRDHGVSQVIAGDALVLLAEETKALASYQTGLAIAENLARQHPDNAPWQVDVALACAKLGLLEAALPISIRKNYFTRGRDILLALGPAGQSQISQHWLTWFEQAIQELEGRESTAAP
ncbi:MAG: TIR domain-containing protein [Cyanobacteriota bacterium]|nr:TIR domain-containing protein [Cyanobacteriota bacterium]